MTGVPTPSGAPAPVAPLPPRGLPQSVHFSMARSVQFSVAIDKKRGRTTYRELHARGLPDWLTRQGAGHGGRWWWEAGLGAMHTALPGSYFEQLGVPRLAAQTSTH